MVQSFLRGRWAPLLTHGSLVLLTALMFWMLLELPFWAWFLPGALIHHRIGILVHEYIHGIPFRRYYRNLFVVTLYDGIMISFGFLELFRATHLSHHKWLNSEKDPAYQSAKSEGPKNGLLRLLYVLEAPQHAKYLIEVFQGKHAYVKPRRIIYGALASVAHIGFWIWMGRPEMIGWLVLLALCTSLVSSSLRGAVEHHGPPDQLTATNEYRTFIPLFNMNRHIHHHQAPLTPWYRLQYRTENPLPAREFFLTWFRVYVSRRYGMLPPERNNRRAA